MNLQLLNTCNDIIIVNTYFGQPVTINPKQIVYVPFPDMQPITISIRCSNNSYVSKGKYTLSIDTIYTFNNVSESQLFIITKEKIRIGPDPVYYERAFLKPTNKLCFSEEYVIHDSKKIKKIFNRARLMHFLLISPIEDLSGLTLILFIIGIFLTYNKGWKLAVIYFPYAYIFLLAIVFFIDKFFNLILKKAFKKNTIKSEFDKYFDNNFIKSYYSNPDRTPFLNEIET